MATPGNNSSNFERRILIEQVRYIESAAALDCGATEDVSGQAHGDFEESLWHRAQSLVNGCDLAAVIGRAEKLWQRARNLAFLLSAILGGFGIVAAITDTHTINIYWLLLVLLGFNLLSMLFWLAAVGSKMRGASVGVLSAALLGVMRSVMRMGAGQPGNIIHEQGGGSESTGHKPDEIITQADRAWLAGNFSGAVGKWQLSKVTHQLWLVYLCSGLIFLVLLLMLRQYDFVWGTTLLSDSAFLKLTDILSAPLNALGFATPSADQVQDTRIGAEQILGAGHRYNWAQFLIGSLLCFGILPRLLLWLWTSLMSAYARRRFTLDLYLPYYIHLRQQLKPLASHGRIVDADDSPAQPPESGKRAQERRLSGFFPGESSAGEASVGSLPHTLPDEAVWVAVELGGNISWPPAKLNADNNLGQVTDRESLKQIQKQLQDKADAVIAVAVSAIRPPDRGVQRTISQLLQTGKQRWLVLLNDAQATISESRMAAWYRLAENCEIPADHVISISQSPTQAQTQAQSEAQAQARAKES